MSVDRIRGRKLQRIRAEHFRKHPLCVRCVAHGKLSLATELDHIKPLCRGGADEPWNRHGLCSKCHVAKTRDDFGHQGSVDPHESWLT